MLFFFFNDTATTEIYTLSLHDALPIFTASSARGGSRWRSSRTSSRMRASTAPACSARPCVDHAAAERASSSGSETRSEEHTSELQSRQYLVCRLLLEKKKNT